MTVKDIERAYTNLREVLHSLPLNYSNTFSRITGAELYLKCENQQKTGSFKVRGAYNKIIKLSAAGKLTEAVAASAGNHAQGVAFAATAAGVSSTIVMPETAPIAKVEATRNYGASVVLHGSCYDDAYHKAMDICGEKGAEFIHAFNDEDIIAGQATVAIEILRDLPTVDMVMVPAGGGGLLAGIAFYIKQINPRVKVVGVQSAGADAIARSFRARELLSSGLSKTIADGIAVKSPGPLTMEYIWKYADDIVTVTDEEIAETILLLLERTKLVVEAAGTAALAAALAGRTELRGQRAVCVLSGGNIDMSFIHKLVEKGLIKRGRQMQFSTIMPDSPGSLSRLTAIVAEHRANVLMVQHDRLSSAIGLDDTMLQMTVEVSGWEHGQELRTALRDAGYQISG